MTERAKLIITNVEMIPVEILIAARLRAREGRSEKMVVQSRA